MQAHQEEGIMIKGKRSKRPRLSSPLTLTMATSSSSSGGGVMRDFSDSSDHRLTPSPSNSGELIQRLDEDDEEEDMAHCLILLAKGQVQRSPAEVEAKPVEVYQCKTCNKTFPSFQALGGHRASHKKPNKPVLILEQKKAIRDEQREDFRSNCDHGNTILSLQISNRVLSSSPQNMKSSKVHECSICGAEFASGQALGGHMRRHRPIPAASSGSHGEFKRPRNLLSLDLNLPAPEDDHTESKFPFGPKEQVIVFSTSALIDCHY